MLIGMKARLFASLSLALFTALAAAETYRSVPITKLEIEGPEEEIDRGTYADKPR